MKRYFLYVLIFSAVLDASSQELQFSQPEILGPEVNSEDEELAPMLSWDGQTLYFSRAFHSKNMGGKYAGTDIWISKKDATGNWTPAVNAGKPWNNKRSNAVIGISADGSTVYLTNAYSNKSGISFSRLVMGKWTKPEFIAVPGINRDDLVGIYVHPAFDVMLISMKGRDSHGEEDLYISLKDSLSSWSQPRNLGSSINTSGFEISPFLSDDKKRLYFSSNGHKGYGDADIFLSDRLYDSWQNWSVPVNLGEHINGPDFDAGLMLEKDSLAVFSSNRNTKLASLYSSKIFYSNKIYTEKVLTSVEKNELLGENVKTILDFSGNEVTLQSANRELIFYIGNKLVGRRDIRIGMEFAPDAEPEINSRRKAAIIAQLALAGFEGSRILEATTTRINPNLKLNQVNLILVR